MLFRIFFAAGCWLAAILPATAATISGDYYEDELQQTSCGILCVLNFALPQQTEGKFVTIEEVGCSYSVSTPFTQVLVRVTDGQNSNARRTHPVNPPAVTGVGTFREPLRLKVAGGAPRNVQVRLFASGASASTTVTCMIVGTISSQ